MAVTSSLHQMTAYGSLMFLVVRTAVIGSLFTVVCQEVTCILDDTVGVPSR